VEFHRLGLGPRPAL